MTAVPFTDQVAGVKTNGFTAPATDNYLVFLWGAGGGGASGLALSRGGGGGGGGALSISVIALTNATQYSYTIGAGGAGGAYSGTNNGSNGGNSLWGAGTSYKAEGGKGAIAGAGGTPGLLANSLGDSLFDGSYGIANDVYNGGNGGKGAGSSGGAGGVNGTQGLGSAGAANGGGGSGGGQNTAGAGTAGGAGGIYIVVAPTLTPGKVQVGFDGSGVLDAAGTSDWTAPADGIVIVECYGSGGGARGGVSLGNGGAGAGGGGYAIKAVTVTKGTVYSRVIPAGGAGSAWNTNSAVNGADGIFKLKNSPGTNLVLAKGGQRSTGTTSGAGAGGSNTGAIGDTLAAGDTGTNGLSTSQDGGNGGGSNGALPGSGGAGGIHGAGTGGGNGTAPGGGGGGGQATTSGSGGSGARGAVIISYYLTLGSIIENGQEKFIVSIKYKDTTNTAGANTGTVHTITDPYRVYGGAKISVKACRVDTVAGQRAKPTYIPAGYEDRFDVTTGVFNWRNAPHVRPAITAKDFQFLVVGDSVSEGWTYLNNLPPYNSTSDFPHAWPRRTRDDIATAVGAAVAGTGFIRACSVNGGSPANYGDTSWAHGGWGTAGLHFLNSSGAGQTATFTSEKAGTIVAVITSGNAASVTIDGVAVANTTASTAGTLKRNVYTGLSNTTHVVAVTSISAGSGLFGVDVYNSGGIKVHDVAQGGSRAALGGDTSPTQKDWSDFSGSSAVPGSTANAPDAMVPTYVQYTEAFGRIPEAVIIMLGGNDAFQSVSDADIGTAHVAIGNALDNSSTDIIMMPDTHTDAQMTVMMQACIDNNWAMIDFFWLSRSLSTIFGQGYNGDTFGHLNSDGAKWCGQLASNALLNGTDHGRPIVTAVSPSSGTHLGGTSITITGKQFIGTGITVKVGGVAATSVVVVSPTSITCTTPAHAAATVDVIVTSQYGVSDSVTADHFTYT